MAAIRFAPLIMCAIGGIDASYNNQRAIAGGIRHLIAGQRLVAAVLAGMLGAFMIWGVGFSPIEALHNAAHDTRHSLAFPCH